MERDLVRGLRELVPRADRETIVAAIDAIADRLAEFARDVALVLDGEIGNAAPRIDLVGRGERARRTDVEAGVARAAMIALRRIGLDLERGEDRAQEQPRAEFARHEIGVLALPADARRRRERLLHHRRGIDEDLDVAAIGLGDPAREPLQPPLEHVVIVAALAHRPRRRRARAVRAPASGSCGGRVIHAQRDDALGLAPQIRRVGCGARPSFAIHAMSP